MFGALAMQNGQVLMNGNGNTTYFDHPAVVGALQFWKDLGEKHRIMPRGTIEWGTLRQNFLEGKTAIMWHSTGNLTAVKKNATFDFGVAMLPASKRRGTPTGGGNFYIFKKTNPAERKAAMRLIKFMTNPENALPNGPCRPVTWASARRLTRRRSTEGVCQGFPLCCRGQGSAPVCHRRAVHISDRPCAKGAG
jgi:ABC-type glycerol-3-phosphate transport system substrate-binding protein